VVAADGEQALDLLLKERRVFDVVVLDVMLPGKDGFTVAAELRAAEQYTPILMLTARGRPEDVLRGFEAGADDYLPKPFELTILPRPDPRPAPAATLERAGCAGG
jgi:DNA-binding response OmpR family regulator